MSGMTEDDLDGILAPAALFEFLLFALLVRIRAVVSLLRGNKCLRAAAGIRRPAYLCALPLTLLRLRLLLRGVLCVAEKERHLRPAGLLPALFLCKCPVVLFLLQNILLFFRGAASRCKRKQRAERFSFNPRCSAVRTHCPTLFYCSVSCRSIPRRSFARIRTNTIRCAAYRQSAARGNSDARRIPYTRRAYGS